MYRLLIADDEQITRKAIRMLVDKYVPEITEILRPIPAGQPLSLPPMCIPT